MEILFKYPYADRVYYKEQSIFNGFPYYDYEKLKPEGISDEMWNKFIAGECIPQGLITFLASKDLLFIDTVARYEDEWEQKNDYNLLYELLIKHHGYDFLRDVLIEFLQSCVNYIYLENTEHIEELFENLGVLWEVSDVFENFDACHYFVKLRIKEAGYRIAFYRKYKLYDKPADCSSEVYEEYKAAHKKHIKQHAVLCDDIRICVERSVNEILTDKKTFKQVYNEIKEISKEYELMPENIVCRLNKQIETELINEAANQYVDLILQESYAKHLYDYLEHNVFAESYFSEQSYDYAKICFRYGCCLEGIVNVSEISKQKLAKEIDKSIGITLSEDIALTTLMRKTHIKIDNIEYDLFCIFPEEDYRCMDVDFHFYMYTLIDSRIDKEHINHIAKEIVRREKNKYIIKYIETNKYIKKF